MQIPHTPLTRRALVKAAAGACLIAFTAASCSQGSRFRVKGNISGADRQKLTIEKADMNGFWTELDSTRTDASGSFSFTGERPAGPEVYRIRLNDRYIYLPVDSTETVEVSASVEDFGRGHTLTGSADAERMARFERDLQKFIPYSSDSDSARNFKRRIFTEYLQTGPGNIVSYYILTKTLADGTPLYDVSGQEDYKYLAAVATGYRQYAPGDPHASMLENFAILAMKNRNRQEGRRLEMQAPEIKLIPINLPDEKGVSRSLEEVTSKGKRTLLVFASLTDANAPALNRELLQLHREGIEIYQVSYDADQYGWREAAANLPWTTVLDATGDQRSAIEYNVTSLPTYFSIDASGNLKDRLSRPGEIRK